MENIIKQGYLVYVKKSAEADFFNLKDGIYIITRTGDISGIRDLIIKSIQDKNSFEYHSKSCFSRESVLYLNIKRNTIPDEFMKCYLELFWDIKL
jgi:hypothetical protein